MREGEYAGKGEKDGETKTCFPPEMAASHCPLLTERGERSWGLATSGRR